MMIALYVVLGLAAYLLIGVLTLAGFLCTGVHSMPCEDYYYWDRFTKMATVIFWPFCYVAWTAYLLIFRPLSKIVWLLQWLVYYSECIVDRFCPNARVK